ncbi:MAG: InlB B-repeat-containing protein [Clostridiales bacterium]|nr:InlB B-repeat-containing protein [Clostridiales bacterium]MDD7053999.1 MBG domain-containing protein [Clostridiales bacterium]MDY5190126.1 MBG domain-containing protein [Eubacteriales bacterium]
MSKKGLKTMLVCIVLLIGLVTLFACNKSDVADKDGQTKVIVKIQDEDGSIYKENVVFSDLFTLSLQKEGYTGRLYRDADFLKPLTKDSKVKNGDTVYVNWTINSYTVTFMDGKTPLKTEKVQHGSAAPEPKVPEKDGKTFKGWDKPFDNVTSDLTINAVYDFDTFTVTFKDGEKVLETQTVEYEAAATAPDTARLSPPEGMHFAKWDKDFSKVTEDIEVSAVYELNEYTVTFKNGETTLKTEMVKHGFAATAPNVYDTATKKFVKWDKSFDNVTSDLIVNAKFETKKFTLTFINFDGTTVYTAEVEYGASIDSHFETADSAATYDDILDYDGWYKADGTRIDELDLPTMPAENFTLTLKLRLMDSAIGDFKVNTPADFTFSEINSAEFTVTPNEGTTLYEGVTYKYIWTINKDNVIYKTEKTTESSLTLQNLDAGKYFAKVRIVASMENCGSVDKEFAGETLTVSRADISGITVTGGTFTYGDENAKIKIDGLKDGDKVFYGKDGVSFSSEIVDFSKCDVGEYKYSVKVVRNENFNEFTWDVVTINVTKAAVTIRFSPNKKELFYGDDLPALTAYVGNKIIGTVEKEDYALKLNEISFSGIATYVGECSIEVKNFSNDYYNTTNFNITFSSYKITISRAKLVVKTLAAEDVVYGNDLSEVGCEITGWKNGDEKTEYTLVPTTTYNKKSSVGPYSFSYGISGERIKYYDTKTNVVSFNVTTRAAEIIINDVKDIVYGDKVPELSAKVKNVLDGDTLSYTLKTDYSAKKKPGGYNAFVEIKEGDNSNYNVSVVNKTFTVLKKELTITLGSKRVAAGKEYKVDAASLTIDGLLADDTVTGYVTITKTETGVYTANDFDKTNLKFDSECYEVIKYDLTVEFVKVDFKIHFEDHEVVYDGQNHSVAVTADDGTNYTITYGTKKGIYDLTDAPSYKNAGVYVTYFKVVDNSLDDGSEYEDEIKLTVKKAEVEIKIGTYTMTYGNELPEFSYEATGLLNGDTLSGEAQYIVEGMTDGNVGTYKVKVGGLSANDNYAITVVPGTLTINQKSIAVVWSTKDKYVYSPDGQEMPAATYDGRSAKVTTNGEFKNAGTYTFTATDESGNYTLTNAVLNVVIEKTTYSGIVHGELSGVYNPAKTLKDYALAEGFTWVDASEKPVCTKPEYAAIYNADSDNYENFELNIAIDLQKAEVALKDGVVEFDYDGASHEIKAVVTYNGVALDTSLYSLTYDGETSKTYTDAGTHRTLVTMEADNYDLPKNTYVYVKVKGVKLKKGNEVTYHTIEDALFNSQSGDTIEFINGVKEVSFAPSDVAEAIYADNAFRMVKGGVTLKLASDEDSSATIGKPTYGAGSARYVDTDSSKIKYKLILNESTVLEVYGNILIQGLLGFSGQQGYQGHTSGNHSQIINNGTINLNNGAKLDLRGYIKGTGKIEARSGATVYSPFVVRDFRGGTSSKKTYEEGVSPFNVYEMPNIQCLYRVEYGATHTAYMDLYSGTLNKHFSSSQNVIANNTAIIILKDKSAGLIKTYDRESEKSNLTIYGNVELGDLSLDWSGITIKMSKVRFPIPWNYSINIGDGTETTNLTAKYDYKIMTGATINVNKKATVNLTGTVVVYKSFTDVVYGNCVYPNKEAGKLNIEGLLNVTGGIAGELFGRAGGQVVIGNKATLSLSSREGYAKRNPVIVSFIEVATISATAELVNAGGNKITAETNKTYNYNNGTWTWQ